MKLVLFTIPKTQAKGVNEIGFICYSQNPSKGVNEIGFIVVPMLT